MYHCVFCFVNAHSSFINNSYYDQLVMCINVFSRNIARLGKVSLASVLMITGIAIAMVARVPTMLELT